VNFDALLKLKDMMNDPEFGPDHYHILLEFYRRPRTKKRRIIKKWKKRIFNWRVPQWYKEQNKVEL